MPCGSPGRDRRPLIPTRGSRGQTRSRANARGAHGEVHRILRYAFLELNLYRVWLTTIAYNAWAVKAFEKAGFRPEGAWREMIHRDGHRFDVLHDGMLRHEWNARRA